jgi:hypothetical protein
VRVRSVLGGTDGQCPAGPWLKKLTVPRREARKLLRLLSEANVDAATIFPGYDAVVKAQSEVTLHA